MKKLQFKLEYWLYKIGLLLVGVLSLPTIWGIGKCIGGLNYYFFRVRFRVVERQIIVVFPGWLPAERHDFIRRYFQRQFFIFLDFIKIMHLNSEMMQSRITNRHECRSRIRLDRPEKVVFITGHYGNFILGTRFVNATVMPVSAVVKRQSNYRIHQDFYRNLSREGMVIWENRKDLRKIVSLAIKDGESLGLMIDQDAGPRGMMIPFLNHPASTATGPFHLIRKFVPRVVVTSMHLEKNLNYHLLIKDLGYLNHLEGKEILTLLNNELSAYVMDHPLDWLWFHRRWKTQL